MQNKIKQFKLPKISLFIFTKAIYCTDVHIFLLHFRFFALQVIDNLKLFKINSYRFKVTNH